MTDARMMARILGNLEVAYRERTMGRDCIYPTTEEIKGMISYLREVAPPLDMVLYCPRCHLQHIDVPDHEWTNPPHRSHLCAGCGHIWRPADVPTVGVPAIKTRGQADSDMSVARDAVSTYRRQHPEIAKFWTPENDGHGSGFDPVPTDLDRFMNAAGGLRTIANAAGLAVETFEHRVKDRKGRLTWWAVNILQDALAAIQGTATRAADGKPRFSLPTQAPAPDMLCKTDGGRCWTDGKWRCGTIGCGKAKA